MSKLHVSPDLALPLDWMTLATVVYGARGSGKTTLGSVIAEEVTKAKQRFCAIDLKGDWYGLKSTADGKGDGIPVIVFGGDHQDVPLEEGAGAFIGETIANLAQPAILDLEYFSKGKQVRFLAQFFDTLYDRNRDPLLLLLDEAQRYAPQKPIDPDAAKCLGAIEDLVKLGRKHGIGPVLFTQRGSGLNKEVSELCDMMVAFRTPGPLDQDRVKGWLEANTTRAQMLDVMGSLSGLPTGTAIFASGHPDLKVFGTYGVRQRETFDSSATPKVGHRRVEPKKLAKPDLESLRSRMAAAIQRQKADDPKALRAEIAALKKERAAGAAAAPKMVQQRVEIAVLKNGALKGLMRASTALLASSTKVYDASKVLATAATDIASAVQPVLYELNRIQSAPNGAPSTALASSPARDTVDGDQVRAAAPRSTVQVPVRSAGVPSAKAESVSVRPRSGEPRVTDGISARQQRFLDAAATLTTLDVEVTRETVAAWIGVHPRGGSVGEELKALVNEGHIRMDRGAVTVTDRGFANASVMSQEQAIASARSGLTPRQQRIFDIIVSVHPDAITREAIAESMGIHPRGGSFGEDLGRLRGRGLIEYERGSARARDFLFAGVA
ncbi:MAG TPA: hypothetical protein VGR85_15570 [Candidatus Limnocylindria bacterium]|jgi:hypothetical protein|nr:hypothetical protein [Candidatus Limnocylindria bacterium]